MVGSEQGKGEQEETDRGVGRKGYKQDNCLANQCWTEAVGGFTLQPP